MAQDVEWPDLPDIEKDDPQADAKLKLYQAQLDHQAAETSADLERQKLGFSNEFAQAQAVNAAYLDVAKGQMDRAGTRGQFVQTAAAAVATVYSGVLGFAFAAGGHKQLPARGAIPTFFLGLSIVLSAVFLSYLQVAPPTTGEAPTGGFVEDQRIRRNTFIEWTGKNALRRVYFLHCAVISLGFGVIFLASPYVGGTDAKFNTFAFIAAGIALVLTFVIPGLVDRFWGRQLKNHDSSVTT
jgi:hypothetical protein